MALYVCVCKLCVYVCVYVYVVAVCMCMCVVWLCVGSERWGGGGGGGGGGIREGVPYVHANRGAEAEAVWHATCAHKTCTLVFTNLCEREELDGHILAPGQGQRGGRATLVDLQAVHPIYVYAYAHRMCMCTCMGRARGEGVRPS